MDISEHMMQTQQALSMSLALRDLELQAEYRSDVHDLVRDFYVPCLNRSTLYRRAAGYFTSWGLSVAAQGISALINSDGYMRLIASPLFNPDDLEAIEKGYLAREDVVTRSLLRQIEVTPDAAIRDRLGYLAWLVAESRLDIRIAVPQNESGATCGGIYHEKLGIFSDSHDNSVAFTGSSNETMGGLVANFEATDVFCSWRDPEGRVKRKITNFERLWSNQTPRLAIRPFPDAVREQLLQYRPKDHPSEEISMWTGRVFPAFPFPPHLWPHQTEAIQAWENNQRRGIVSMATGSGKTLTALVAAQRCSDLALLVIVVPRSALVEQWRDELRKHTSYSSPIMAYESATQWQEALFNRLRAARKHADQKPIVVVGTMKSISETKFESVLDDGDPPGNLLLIVDEVHNVGAPSYRRCLRSRFDWRLGLSATPARHFDEEGTHAIREYFEATVFTYDMRRALENGHLCPYRYYVYPAHLNEDEYAEYRNLTRQIIQLRKSGDEQTSQRTDNALDGDSGKAQRLLFRRARILKKCGSKLEALGVALDKHPIRRGLVYCADNDQLGDVSRLFQQRQTVYLTYTADTSNPDRSSALQALAAGQVPVVVAIDCLDEGVDVPNVDEAIILASSSNKRQFIQRRGRVLRRAEGKSFATLIDIIALPPTSAGLEARWMLDGEFARVKEMAELASNKHDALLTVKACAEPYGVLLTELLSGEGDG